MSSHKKLWLAAALVCLPGLGCQKLIGLEERQLASDGGKKGSDAGGSDAGPDAGEAQGGLCEQYCDDVLAACSGGNDTFVSTADYGSKQVCLEVCRHVPEGDAEDPDANGHTLACRAKNARLAGNLNDLEKRLYCPAAGPGGGSPGANPSCGSNCQAYCQLYGAICPAQPPEDCERLCAAIPDTGAVNANRDFSEFPDTIQCRLAHLSVAAFDAPKVHCEHARLVPKPDDLVSCDLGADQSPNCEDYCRLVGVACTGERALYESPAQCMSVCGALPPGTAKENEGNSLACRRWRAYGALLDPGVFCGVAGPVGKHTTIGENCGEPCDVYCDLLQAGCGSAFDERFAGDRAACKTDCEALPFDGSYSAMEGVPGKTLECRVLNLSRALTGDQGACASAVGQGDC